MCCTSVVSQLPEQHHRPMCLGGSKNAYVDTYLFFFLLLFSNLSYKHFVPDEIKSQLCNLNWIINLLKCNQLVTTVSKPDLHPLEFIHKHLT